MAIVRNGWFILFNCLEYVLQGVLGEPGGIVPGVSTYQREPLPLYVAEWRDPNRGTAVKIITDIERNTPI